jgi:hypothetical protein
MDFSVNILDPAGNSLSKVAFNILNRDQMPSGNLVFNNAGQNWPNSSELMLGFSFFLGKSVYFAFDHRTMTGNLRPGPWVGYVDPAKANLTQFAEESFPPLKVQKSQILPAQ